jgi:hypothetical protein
MIMKYYVVAGGYSDGVYFGDERILSASAIESAGYNWWSFIGATDANVEKWTKAILRRLGE